jgi:hypothetical protein
MRAAHVDETYDKNKRKTEETTMTKDKNEKRTKRVRLKRRIVGRSEKGET